ncbi:MAG: ABC transporter permease [Dehalococcoidia bacterium]|nr:ABC transporter permease [Dehalococcoidia bacterium]
MTAYILRRVLLIVPLLLLLTIFAFVLNSVVPGDPTGAILGENANPEAKRQVEQELGLDRPMVVRYLDWLGNAAQGDFGRSYVNRQPITQQLQDRFPVTLELALVALVVATLLGIPLGVIAAVRPGSIVDRLAMVFAVAGVALPNFFLATLLVLFFSVKLHWLPATGWIPFSEDPVEHIRHVILPAATLVLTPTAIIARMMRTSMVGVLAEDYVRTARAKGLRKFTVVVRHALRNAMIPTLTVLGLQLSALLGGTIIIESVFGLPGLGRLALTAVTGHDSPTIQAVVLLIGTGVLTISLLVDLLYAYVNPRIRYA